MNEEIKTLMEDHDLDEATSKQAQEFLELGLNEDEAVEIAEIL